MWDDKINEAARQLTDSKASEDFRERVLARINARRGGTRDVSPWRSRWLLLPIAGAAMLILTVLVSDNPRPADVPPSGRGGAGRDVHLLTRPADQARIPAAQERRLERSVPSVDPALVAPPALDASTYDIEEIAAASLSVPPIEVPGLSEPVPVAANEMAMPMIRVGAFDAVEGHH